MCICSQRVLCQGAVASRHFKRSSPICLGTEGAIERTMTLANRPITTVYNVEVIRQQHAGAQALSYAKGTSEGSSC